METAGFSLSDDVHVVDHGSIDDTGEIAQSFGVNLLSNATSQGAAAARAYAAKGQGGYIFLFVDADVIVAPDTKIRVLQAFKM